MKIDKITLCNLTALHGEQVIDFSKEPLRSAGLFAITGDTGAGKSTVLDAVCLALYGRAPRFEGVEKIKREELERLEERTPTMDVFDARGILRRGCKEGYARVEFTVGDGERYEAGWSLRVKRTGTYDRASRTLRQLSPRKESIPEKEIDVRLPEILGLNYAQFTRTVLLAQNSFATFLRAKRDEKSALLEKLTGTEVYGRISVRIHERAAVAERRVDSINDVISGIMHDRLQPEEIAALGEEQTLLTASAAGVAEREALVSRQLRWFADFDAARDNVMDKENACNEAHKNRVAARQEELELERYDSVLTVQPLYQEIIVRRRDIDDIKVAEEHCVLRLEAERQRMEQAATEFTVAHNRVVEAEKRMEQRRSAISRGHVLNGEIGEALGQFKNAEEQLQVARGILEEREVLQHGKSEQLAETQQKLEAQLLHKQALSVHRMMFEKFDLVKDKLTALTAETRRNAEAHKKFVALQKQQNLLQASSEKYRQQQQNDQSKLSSLKSELFIHRQSNQGQDSARLQQRFSDNRNRLLSLERAQALWQRISLGYEYLEDKRAEVSRLLTSQDQLRRERDKAVEEVEVLEEAYRRQNVAFTLSQSASIVQLRKQLKEGTPCPVCGGTHHPYHTETERELGELLNNLEKDFNETAEALKAARAKCDDLRSRLDHGEGRLASEQKNLAEREARQTADVAEWGACADLDVSFKDCSPSVARDARRLMIELLTDNTRRAVDEAKKDLETFNFHQGHINRLNEQISALEAQMADNHARIDDLNTQFQIAKASAEDAEKAMQLSDRSCSALYVDLDAMVTVSGWFTDWKNNSDGFRMRLTSLHNDWLLTTKEVDALQRSEVLLREELKAIGGGLTEARHHLTQATQQRDAVSEALKGKREELQHLFGDSTPEKEEELLQKAISEARNDEAEMRKTHDEAASNLGKLQGEQQTLSANRLQRQEEYGQKMSELDLWILRYNADHSPLQFVELENIFSSVRDWKALRLRLDLLKKAQTLAENDLQAARKALLALNAVPDRPTDEGEETRDALAATARHLKEEAEKINEALVQIRLKLQAHEKSCEQAARYEEQLQAARSDAEEWKRLDSLLGSADGKKFRELAQSCTFRFLVEHANNQLRQFSPRYELQNIPGTLTLEIIDREMFDEHRYVSSLSGGESFVVSLALALGLASLSSNNLAIGSLFIDEGFGNLDSASLDLVMIALSNLENAQGRKVGVISHTDQIRSQISPQIRLIKEPTGGRSRIEIG